MKMIGYLNKFRWGGKMVDKLPPKGLAALAFSFIGHKGLITMLIETREAMDRKRLDKE